MYNTSKYYKERVLEDSTQHELNIYIDENKIEPNHIIDFSSKSELFNNNEFCLGCTPERDIEFEIDKRDLPENHDEVYVETGIKYHEDIVTEGENITLKEEKEIPLNLEISGNSEQETRSGKENICRITGIFNTNAKCIKATYNADRSMTFEKIADINAIHFGFVLNNTTTQNISSFMKYKIETSKEACNLYLRVDNGSFLNGIELDITGKNSEIIWTGNSAGKNVTALSFTSTNLNVGDKITVYSIYAVLGDTFEPIMPSLDYRSEVKCCGDNVNLFNLDNYYNYANVNKCTKQLLSNGVILNFTAGDDAWIGNVYSVGNTIPEIYRPACTKVKPNTTYTLKISSAPKCYMSFFDKDYKAVKNYIQIPSDNYIFTTDSSTYYIYLRLGYQDRTSGQTSYDFTDIKCVEGTEVGGYSKHGQGCITEVISNKNLCDFSKQQYSYIGLTSELNNNIWKISGTSTSTDYIFSFGRLSLGKLKAGTYNFSWKYNKYNISCGKNSLPLISLYNKNISQIYMNKRINTDDKYSKFTLTEDTEIWLGMWNDGTGNVYDIEIECQLELSEINTEIVSHKEQTYTIPTQQPLRSIGDIRDTFIKINNKWFERHYIERLILNGTETFDSWTGKAPSGYSVFYSKILTTVINSQRNLKCNALKYMENPWESGKNAIGLQRTFKELYISIDNTYASTLEDFKTYLKTQYDAGTPIYVDYVLQTPQDIECTEEQSKILDELSNATTYEEATHIYSTDSIAPVLKTTCGSEIVPIGHFTIETIEDDEFKVKIKATDYMKRFEDNKYDGSNLTYPKTMLEVLKDICKKVGVELGSTSFLNSEKQISVYDNTVTARTYLGYIAEQACGFAVIGRDGKLYIKTFGENSTDFDIDLFGDFTWGDNFKVSKVSYEDGIQNYKFGDETQATVFIDQNNMYIVDSKQVENIYNQIKDFEIYTFEGETIIDPSYDIGDVLVIDGKKVLYQGEIKYAGKFKASINNKVQAKTEQESMQTKQSNSNKIKRVQSKINQIDGKITQLVQETSEHEEKLTQAQQDIDGFTQKVFSKDEVTEKINELKHTIDNITFQQQTKGGGNIFFYAKEYWKGSTDNSEATLEEYTNTLIQQNNISDEGYLINNGVSIQSQVVKNGQYVISFNYYKLKADATGYVKVNNTEYKLDGNVNTWIEKVIPVEITSNNIKIEMGSDAVTSYYISDLMVAVGTEKSVWTQNANETRTDTVEIGKGIQVNSSTKNTYTRIDADGNRTFNSSTNERVAEMTDKGLYTKQLEVKEDAKINSLIIQQIGNQIWLTGLGG